MLSFVKKLPFEEIDQIITLVLVQNDHHIGSKAENGNDTTSQEECNPRVGWHK